MEHKQHKVSILALGLALGVMWGLSILFIGLLAQYINWGHQFINLIGSLYIGYEPTILGSLIGGFLAFIDAFIAGAVVAWLYNIFSAKLNRNQS